MKIKIKPVNKTVDTSFPRKAEGAGNQNFNPRKYVAVDTESTGVDVWKGDEAFMVAMADEDGNTWCCTWDVDPFTRRVNPKVEDVGFILDVLEIPGIEVIFHNSKFDVKMLSKLGNEISYILEVLQKRGAIHDTLFMARICFTLELSYGLKQLASQRLGIPNQDEKDLQADVVSARRKLTSYNTRAKNSDTSSRLMNKSEEIKADYWLPRYFDPNNKSCEKYCRLDVYRTIGLFFFYKDIMEDDHYLKDAYELEMRQIWPIVNLMEERGMAVSPKSVKEETKVCKQAMETHLANMQQIILHNKLCPFDPVEGGKFTDKEKQWEDFNPSSPPQLARILYLPEDQGGLGIEPHYARKGKNAGKSLTTDKDTLEELMYIPFVYELAKYRAAKHTLGLFFEKFDNLMVPDKLVKRGFALHPGLNQCGTKTGRFSCISPNLQQVSAGGEKSLSASYSSTKVFKPREGYYWLGFDYAQQEGRIFAELAGVKLMLDAFNSDQDIFTAMSNKAWGGPNNPRSRRAVSLALDLTKDTPSNDKVKEVWKHYDWHKGISINGPIAFELMDDWIKANNYSIVDAEKSVGKKLSRQRSKHITYATIFGGTYKSYTHLLKCTPEEAKIYDIEYHSALPEMKVYMKQLQKQAMKDGFIINLYDRKLRVDRHFAYRAVSYMIQGTAASMMKDALIRVHEFISSTKLDAHIIMTIHDEIKIEIAKKDFSMAFVRAIANRMEDVGGRLKVPMPVGVSLCEEYWGKEEEIEL